MRLVAQAQSSRSRAQALADRAAFRLTIVAVVAAVVTLLGWLLAGEDASFVVERVVTVLVIACPHALGGFSGFDSFIAVGCGGRTPHRAFKTVEGIPRNMRECRCLDVV